MSNTFRHAAIFKFGLAGTCCVWFGIILVIGLLGRILACAPVWFVLWQSTILVILGAELFLSNIDPTSPVSTSTISRFKVRWGLYVDQTSPVPTSTISRFKVGWDLGGGGARCSLWNYKFWLFFSKCLHIILHTHLKFQTCYVKNDCNQQSAGWTAFFEFHWRR